MCLEAMKLKVGDMGRIKPSTKSDALTKVMMQFTTYLNRRSVSAHWTYLALYVAASTHHTGLASHASLANQACLLERSPAVSGDGKITTSCTGMPCACPAKPLRVLEPPCRRPHSYPAAQPCLKPADPGMLVAGCLLLFAEAVCIY